MTLEQTLLKRVDEQACIDFLAEMVRHRSYSETEGERELALFMQRAMREIGLESKLQPVTGKRGQRRRAARRERRVARACCSTGTWTPNRPPEAGPSTLGRGGGRWLHHGIGVST